MLSGATYKDFSIRVKAKLTRLTAHVKHDLFRRPLNLNEYVCRWVCDTAVAIDKTAGTHVEDNFASVHCRRIQQRPLPADLSGSKLRWYRKVRTKQQGRVSAGAVGNNRGVHRVPASSSEGDTQKRVQRPAFATAVKHSMDCWRSCWKRVAQSVDARRCREL
jgi:hypothetical protein